MDGGLGSWPAAEMDRGRALHGVQDTQGNVEDSTGIPQGQSVRAQEASAVRWTKPGKRFLQFYNNFEQKN